MQENELVSIDAFLLPDSITMGGMGWAGGLERERLKRGEGRERQAIHEKKGETGKKIRREMKGRVRHSGRSKGRTE